MDQIDIQTLSRITRKAPGEETEDDWRRWARSPFKDPTWMTHNISSGEHAKAGLIAHYAVQQSTTSVSADAGYEFMCSYSWIQSTKAAIYVPGTPAKWDPPYLPIQLPLDRGLHWIDQHAQKVPRFQFEPMFQALAIMNPTVRFDDVDIVVNRNTLQKLYRFAEYKRSYRQFFVDLDMVGRTMFISRRERNAKTRAQDGHGRSFEKTFTTEDPTLAHVDGHHRVIRYQLGALSIVVRMEVDGYYDEKELVKSNDTGFADSPTQHHDQPQYDAPNEHFRNLFGAVGSASEVIPHSNRCHTQVITQGRLMSHNSTIELKSNAYSAESIQQIWFGRVPHIIYGRHRAGLIGNPEECHWNQASFERWATTPKNQTSLRRLVWLLGEMKRLVVEKTNGHAVLVAIERGAPFQVFQAKQSWGALPGDIIERFWDEAAKPWNRGSYYTM